MKALKEDTLTKRIVINAPASAVWKALTDPAMIKSYFYGTEVATDWKEGSAIIFRGEWEGHTYEDKGVIVKIIPQKLFRYNYWSNLSGTEDVPDNYAHITYELEEKDGQTTLSISQDGFRNKEAREHSDQSWGEVMNAMKKLIEENEKR